MQTTAGGKGFTSSLLTSGNTGLIPPGFFRGNNSESSTTVPKAYINYIFFDEQFKYAGGGYSRVGTSGTVKDHWQADASLQNIAAPKNGYIFVYVSNESNFEVFFDNLQVIHKPGAILEETHYYPFGLTMAGISSKTANTIRNRLQFLGKELQSQEFTDGTGLELYDFGARMYNQQIRRWFVNDPMAHKMQRWSPYNYCFNNPVNFIDPDGMESVGADGLTNDQWMNASRPGADPNAAKNFREENKAEERQQQKNSDYWSNFVANAFSNNGFSSQSYESPDGAAAGWLLRYGEVLLQSGIEWSSVIYSFTSGGNTYYGYSPLVHFSDYDASQGDDPYGSSPGWGDSRQMLPSTFAYKIVGGIHLHTLVSGTPTNPKNEDFSKRDKNNNQASPGKNLYLATPTLRLRIFPGMQVETSYGIFESNRPGGIIGQVNNGRFNPNGFFEGQVAPIKTGWRDVIYGSSLRKSKN